MLNKKKVFLERKGDIAIAAMMIIIVVICLVHGIRASYNINFFPINGTFQNYNPVRRMLSGQIPFRDFKIYLGLGHMYFGGILTWFLGNDFAASLIAFSFLSLFSFSLITLVIGKAVFGSWEKAGVVTILLLILLLQISDGTELNFYLFSEIKRGIMSSLSAGNSARYVRGMITGISALGFIQATNFLFQNIRGGIGYKKYCKGIVIVSIISGISFLWSNDYGISCWLCSIIVLFFIIFFRKGFKKAFSLSLFHILGSISAVIIAVEILTFGHFNDWLSSTFGAGGYQKWYYLFGKSYYLWDVDFSFIMLLQGALCVVYLYKIFRDKGSENSFKRYGILCYLNMTGFCAVNEYKLISGGSAREVALAIFGVTILYECLNICTRFITSDNKILAEKKISWIAISLSFIWIIAEVKDEVISFHINERGSYNQALGGYLTAYNSDLENAKQFLDGEKIFSTYASALETVTEQFQPSGIDYIIHVLGDKTREDYLNSFRNEDFEYVTTINETYSEWELWVRNANWFFYRELYAQYHPVYSNAYQTFWEKGGEASVTPLEVEVQRIDDCNTKIIVKAKENINGVADVLIDYCSMSNHSKRSFFVFNPMIMVSNNTATVLSGSSLENFFLREGGKEYIPITVIDGYGEVVLTSEPKGARELTVSSALCDNIYLVNMSYIKFNSIGNENGRIKFVIVENTSINRKRLENAKALLDNDKKIDILSVEEYEDELKINIKNGEEIKFDDKKNVMKICYN